MPQVAKNFNPTFSKREANDTVKLAKKGDSITIRLADYPVYYGQHWIETDGKKKPVGCPLVNSADPTNPESCGYCEEFASSVDKVADKDLKVNVKFIFAALDKGQHRPIFFETSQMVWTEMVNAEKKGINIFAYDWLIERVENLPKYYEITRLEKDPLTEIDQKAYDAAKKLDLRGLADYKMGNSHKEAEFPEITAEEVSKNLEANAPEEMPF